MKSDNRPRRVRYRGQPCCRSGLQTCTAPPPLALFGPHLWLDAEYPLDGDGAKNMLCEAIVVEVQVSA